MLVYVLTAATALLAGIFCTEVFAPAVAFLVALAVSPAAIPFLHKLKFGQEIREEGPSWHQKKSGTPTMGGVIFIAAIIIASVIFLHDDFKTMMVLYLSVSFGIIGFIDDYIKVVKKRNLGLTEKQKLTLQIIVAVIFVWLLARAGMMKTSLELPFLSFKLEMGALYYPLAILVIIGAVNAVNLTDGLDGLATSVTIIVMLFFMIVLKKTGDAGVSEYAGVCAAALVGFLWFNRHPAKIFMGDTGSLFLGGALAAMAVADGLALVLFVAGGIYVAETLSVIIQVSVFKLTGKRVFKMSPLHHHFEMCDWSETTIVAVFSAVTFVLCVLMYLGVRM